jgi:hypothetical protein
MRACARRCWPPGAGTPLSEDSFQGSTSMGPTKASAQPEVEASTQPHMTTKRCRYDQMIIALGSHCLSFIIAGDRVANSCAHL